MKFARRIGALLGAVAATGAASASASPLSPATYGPVRAWGATKIQSLDPARHSGAVSDHTSRRVQVLSNENTFTRWAYVTKIAWIHRAPGGSSPRIERLGWFTADGFASIYLVLRADRDARGREWVKCGSQGAPTDGLAGCRAPRSDRFT